MEIWNKKYNKQTWRILIIFINPIKNLNLICVKENRLVDAEYSKQIFYFVQSNSLKKNNFKLPKKYKPINITHFWGSNSNINVHGICLCE